MSLTPQGDGWWYDRATNTYTQSGSQSAIPPHPAILPAPRPSMTLDDAAGHFGVSRGTVATWIYDGDIETVEPLPLAGPRITDATRVYPDSRTPNRRQANEADKRLRRFRGCG